MSQKWGTSLAFVAADKDGDTLRIVRHTDTQLTARVNQGEAGGRLRPAAMYLQRGDVRRLRDHCNKLLDEEPAPSPTLPPAHSSAEQKVRDVKAWIRLEMGRAEKQPSLATGVEADAFNRVLAVLDYTFPEES